MSADQHEAGRLAVRLLGPVTARRGGSELDVPGAQPRAALALLALRVGERVATDELIDGIWDGGAPAQARHALHVFVSELRRRLGHDAIATTTGGYELMVDRSCVDAWRFDELGRRAAAEPAVRGVPLLREALALWRGAPLADVPGTPVLTAWAKELDERRYAVLESCLAAELELGRHTLVVGELARLVTIAPLREELRASLMLALYRCGRQAEALAVFREGRRLLVDELGIEPGPGLRGLERAILAQDPALDANGTATVVPEDGVDLVARGVAIGESWYTSLRLREPSAFAALDQNAASLAQAVCSAIERGDRSSALRIIGTTWFYWLIRGRYEEAYAWSKQSLALPGRASLDVETKGHIAASELARVCTDFESAVRLKQEALELSEELGDERAVEALLADLGHLWVTLGDLDVAASYADRALEARERNPANRGGVAHALLAVGDVAHHRGDLAAAEACFLRALEVCDEGGLAGEGASVRARLLGRTIRARGEFDRAFGVYHRALQDALPSGDRPTIAAAEQGLGWVAAMRGDYPGAVRRYAGVSGEEWQQSLEPEERALFAADLEWLRALVPEELFEAAWRVGIAADREPAGVL